ncbi:MAG: alpha/beta fold hydrolase [Promethearchaeota archaeon]
MPNIIFIHGLESSGHGFKGNLLRQLFPECLTPDFKKYNNQVIYKDLLEERMNQLISILNTRKKWNLIGSSFGGLMAALYTCIFPEKVVSLILLAPLLAVPKLNPANFKPIDVSVVIYHGKYDKIVPINPTHTRAKQLFTNLTYNIVDDDHLLHPTVKNIDWMKLIKDT